MAETLSVARWSALLSAHEKLDHERNPGSPPVSVREPDLKQNNFIVEWRMSKEENTT
jgi:hypothetical protein